MSDRHNRVLRIVKPMLEERRLEGPLTPEIIGEEVDRALALNPAWQAQLSREALIRDVEAQFSIYIGRAAVLTDRDEHRPWLATRKINWRFWGRFREWLESGWAPASIDELDRITARALDLLGDPERLDGFDRRGLIAGDVQAGKTSNYTGVICKAADAGYKVIIVLAGLHDSLRSQTQLRLDEGFLGYDSRPIEDGDAARHVAVGVGLLNQDPDIRVDTITNRGPKGDFNRRVAGNFNIHAGGRPLLYIVKKNVSVLQNVLAWIDWTSNRQDPATGRRHVAGVPLLMIDDEADVASIDTRKQEFDEAGRPDPDHDPSRINSLIRQILMAFDMSSYVGYTATPFANVFIHDQGATEREGPDLFPRSFIINLRPPSNYIGPVEVFGLQSDDDRVEPLPLFHTIDDHISQRPGETSDWMPARHRKEHRPLYNGRDEVPPSLEQAIRSFVLACCVRRARGQHPAMNSMLVHVTRYQNVQTLVAAQIQAVIDQLKRWLRHGGGDSAALLLKLRALWESDFVPVTGQLAPELPEVGWSEVEGYLEDVCGRIEVRTINGFSSDVLDYERYKHTGLDVIAVGGDKLARGLTLEGLTTSYFLRASKMYDTLMQMGRWFGYRPGYVDVCRFYMTEELQEWFEHITEAGEELRREFDHMAAVGGTPEEYGLKVKSHATLLITSKVKMKHGTELRVSFAGSVSETTIFHREAAVVAQNFEATGALVRVLDPAQAIEPRQQRPGGEHRWKGTKLWSEVPVDHVLSFLSTYRTHPQADRANTALLASYIHAQLRHEELSEWTVALLSNPQGEEFEIGGAQVKAFLRNAKVAIPPHEMGGRYVIRRLLAPRDEGIDLPFDDWNVALQQTEMDWRQRPHDQRRRETEPINPSGPALRARRPATRGLLLLYPLTRFGDDPVPLVEGDLSCIGFGISFPGSRHAETVSYRVNNVFWQQEYGGQE